MTQPLPKLGALRLATPLVLCLALGLTACAPDPVADTSQDSASMPPGSASASTSGSVKASPSPDAAPAFPAGSWEMVSSGEGDGLFFGASEGEPGKVHIFCPAGGGILVNVNSFSPVASEERMSLGSSGEVVALVADPAGDASRGGVSGEGPVPSILHAILTGPQGVGVNYGYQNIGPLPPVPAATAKAFVSGCAD